MRDVFFSLTLLGSMSFYTKIICLFHTNFLPELVRFGDFKSHSEPTYQHEVLRLGKAWPQKRQALSVLNCGWGWDRSGDCKSRSHGNSVNRTGGTEGYRNWDGVYTAANDC